MRLRYLAGGVAVLALAGAGAWLLWPEPTPPAPVSTAIVLPSGIEVDFQDVIWGEPGPAGLTVRFRFVSPAIAQDGVIDLATLEPDMQYLCENYALKRISAQGPQPGQVIISLSDRPVAFGETAPDATQFFEAYRPENGACIWEGF